MTQCSSWSVTVLSIAALGCASTVAGSATASHPDLSGVWGEYFDRSQPSIRDLRAHKDFPFTSEGRRKVDAYRALVTPSDDSPGKFCLGYGLPESMLFSGGYPMEIVERPDELVILYEAQSELRHVYLGRKIIAPDDRVPDRDGYSAGHWEGDTLVVETSSLKEQEDNAYPHTAQAQFIERYHLTHDAQGRKILEDDWTLTDPAFYTRPVSGMKKWTFEPKGVLLPYECNEEEWLDHLDTLEKQKGGTLPAVY
ncbi:MAG TPA: hypothetical protein VMD49_01215 [Steroidobacteraceae bacterium]|nr:hypothetical protein [Steroidobacteraceae bacterium]